MTKTILVLAANPNDTSRLRLDQEVREIDNGLQRARRRDEFDLKQVWAVRRSDFRRAMLDTKPNIVHFCGHGSGEKGIAFEDEMGQAKLISSEALSGFFELFADTVECVVLNACYSEIQAEAIAKHIPYVIGMNKAIGDTAAIEFAVAFYDGLGAGEPVEFAYKLACNAIQLAGMSEYLVPELKSSFPEKQRVSAGKSSFPFAMSEVAGDAKEYGNYIEAVVRSLSISPSGKIYRDKEYLGTRQPGSYKIDVSLEVNIDEVLSLLIIIDAKNWKSMVGRETIQNLIQTRDAISAHKAICVSQFGFSQEAVDVAKAQGVGLWMFAKGRFEVYGGGGLAAMSVGTEMARIFSKFLHEELMYCGSYTDNLVHYGYPECDQVIRNLVPYEWIRGWHSRVEPDVGPEYEASCFGNTVDPLMSEIMQYILAHLDSGGTVCKKVNCFLSNYLQILQRAGINTTLSQQFLDEIVRISVKGGLPFVKYNGHWEDIENFDKQMDHKTAQLLAPVEWLKESGQRFFIYASNPPEHFTSVQNNVVWANVAWLLHLWQQGEQQN